MENKEPKGPFCQSCSMPMVKPEDFGTDENGYRINDYCKHCFVNGKFTWKDATMEQMISFCTGILAKETHMPEEKAKQILSEFIPTLKRWKNKMENNENFEELELTVDQNNDAWDYISDIQSEVCEKSTGEQLRKLFKDTDLTLGQKIYIAYIFGRTEDLYRELRKIENEAE